MSETVCPSLGCTCCVGEIFITSTIKPLNGPEHTQTPERAWSEQVIFHNLTQGYRCRSATSSPYTTSLLQNLLIKSDVVRGGEVAVGANEVIKVRGDCVR